jgi:hypothetical protein|tara:strand:+ start:566 stop:835 length:270 start_codon:yes stop_codon:yes gene_type:complete
MHPPLIDGILGTAGDWVRYNAQTWFLWTEWEVGPLSGLLRKHLMDEDSFIVFPFDPLNANGWSPNWVWAWFQARMEDDDKVGRINSSSS